MNWRTCILLTVSIVAAATLSCHGPETGALNPNIAVESDTASPTQGSLDTETPKSESEARLLESNRSRKSRTEKTRYQKELIALDGLAASFL
jgi:photosystem II stability/assembly factor-like uncharacterized protein